MNFLHRIWYWLSLVVYLVVQILSGSFRNLGQTLRRTDRAMILQMPLRARTDLEVFLVSSLIAATPDSFVVGTAAAMPGSPRGDQPATLFVHLVGLESRVEAVAHLHDLEARVLRATRGHG